MLEKIKLQSSSRGGRGVFVTQAIKQAEIILIIAGRATRHFSPPRIDEHESN